MPHSKPLGPKQKSNGPTGSFPYAGRPSCAPGGVRNRGRHRVRRGQALDATRKQRKEAISRTSRPSAGWLTTPHSVRGTLTLNPDRYDAERELWNYTLHCGPDDGGVRREGLVGRVAEEAAVWSKRTLGTAELVLNIVWASSGIPQIVRAEGAGSKLEPQGWVHPRNCAPRMAGLGMIGDSSPVRARSAALENGRLGNPHP